MTVPIGLLSAVTFLPAAGALVLALLPRRRPAVHRAAGLLIALATLAVSVPLWTRFDGDSADFQFEEVYRAIRALMAPPAAKSRPIGFTADIS